MSEPTTPTQTKPKVEIPAGWVAFCHESEKRALGITQFTAPSIAYTTALIVVRPTINALLEELNKRGISLPPVRPSQG